MQAQEISVLKQCNEELRSKLHCEEQEVKELLGKVVKLEAENAAKDLKLGGARTIGLHVCIRSVFEDIE